MKIHHRHWEGGKRGTISMTPEDTDDIWCLYNVIAAGDEVESQTMRRVIQESSSGGNDSSHKVKLWMLVRVEKIDVDLKAASLRLNGRNIRESEHIKMGSYHTLDVEPGRKVKITKDEWTALDLELLEQAALLSGKSEVAAVCLEEGRAYFCFVSANGEVRTIDKVERAIPKRKLGPTSKTENAIDSFFTSTELKLREVFELVRLKALVLAGPARDELYKRLIDNAVRAEDKELLSFRSKFVRVPTSTVSPIALKEILQEPRIAALLADTKTAQESKLLDQLHKAIHEESQMAVYGFSQVAKAADQGAVKHLLLSDSLFRSVDFKERRRYSDLVDTVKQNGGSVHVMSAGSETEKRLFHLTGVAAILQFPAYIE